MLAAVFVVNLTETAVEARWSPTVTNLGLELASALHWLEGNFTFASESVPSAVTVYGYSLGYYVLFPILVLTVALTLALQPDPQAFRTYAFAIATAYALSLPFFLLFPVPERWRIPRRVPSSSLIFGAHGS